MKKMFVLLIAILAIGFIGCGGGAGGGDNGNGNGGGNTTSNIVTVIVTNLCDYEVNVRLLIDGGNADDMPSLIIDSKNNVTESLSPANPAYLEWNTVNKPVDNSFDIALSAVKSSIGFTYGNPNIIIEVIGKPTAGETLNYELKDMDSNGYPEIYIK